MNTEPMTIDVAMEILSSIKSSTLQLQKAIFYIENNHSQVKHVSIGISSNVTLDRLAIFLKRQALLSDIKLSIDFGNYDTLIDDVALFKIKNVDYLLYLPMFDNLMPSFESQIAGGLSSEIINDKIEEFKVRLGFALNEARSLKEVYIGAFHRSTECVVTNCRDRVSDVILAINNMIAELVVLYPNVKIIDLRQITESVGHKQSFDFRFYFQSKAPYSSLFFNEFSSCFAYATRNFGTRYYKAILLDCDNTLWGGVIGEDLISGIKLSSYDYPGNIFWRVQRELIGLEQAGAILCLCTKNNIEDVEEVLNSHPEMAIRSEHLTIKKINWTDKVQNIKEIAVELNIGLDSLVFLDDSDFECEAVRSQLPMVCTLQVPKNLSDYPAVIEKVKRLFLSTTTTLEGSSKTEQYRQLASARKLQASFGSQEEYLSSLQLKVILNRNDIVNRMRISELSQKSNQFNLTTQRYSLGEIDQLIKDSRASVYSMAVSDRFGNAGITGVIIMNYEAEIAEVENFFMSCRVIGRGIEFAIWRSVFLHAVEHGCKYVRAKYKKTERNELVEEFYDKLGLTVIHAEKGIKLYQTLIEEIKLPESSWVEVLNA